MPIEPQHLIFRSNKPKCITIKKWLCDEWNWSFCQLFLKIKLAKWLNALFNEIGLFCLILLLILMSEILKIQWDYENEINASVVFLNIFFFSENMYHPFTKGEISSFCLGYENFNFILRL